MSETAKAAVFVVNGKEYPVATDLDLGEMCDAETLFGVDFSDPRETARDIAAMIYIAIKRVDPTVTVADVRTIPAADLGEITKQVRASRKDDARPPDSDEKTLDSEEPSSQDSSPASEHDQEQTHVASGDPGSENGTGSDLVISGT